MTITVKEKLEHSNISQDKKHRTMPKMTITITTNKKIPFFTSFMTARERKEHMYQI